MTSVLPFALREPDAYDLAFAVEITLARPLCEVTALAEIAARLAGRTEAEIDTLPLDQFEAVTRQAGHLTTIAQDRISAVTLAEAGAAKLAARTVKKTARDAKNACRASKPARSEADKQAKAERRQRKVERRAQFERMLAADPQAAIASTYWTQPIFARSFPLTTRGERRGRRRTPVRRRAVRGSPCHMSGSSSDLKTIGAVRHFSYSACSERS